MSKSKSAAGTSPFFVVFVVFLVLKLTDVIDWSWWAVTAPLWAPPILVVAVFLTIGSVILAAVVSAPLVAAATAGAFWLFERASKFFRGLTR